MGLKYLSLLGILAASPALGQDVGNRLNLDCRGSGQTEEDMTTRVRTQSSNGQSTWANATTSATIQFNDRIKLWVEGGAAQIQMPVAMLPDLHSGKDGWFEVKNVSFNDREIRGKIQVNLFNHPSLIINRVDGSIDISGKLGDYKGICVKYDPNDAARAF